MHKLTLQTVSSKVSYELLDKSINWNLSILVHTTVPTLWSGTNSSCVSIFVLHIPQRTGTTPDEAPKAIVGQLAKEIQIKHRAPVISISLFDAVSSKFILLKIPQFT